MRATLPTPPGQTLVKQLDLLKKSGFDGIQLGVQARWRANTATHRTPTLTGAWPRACRDGWRRTARAFTGGITFFRRRTRRSVNAGLEDAHFTSLEMRRLAPARGIFSSIQDSLPLRDPMMLLEVRAGWMRALKEKGGKPLIFRLGLGKNVWNKFLMSPYGSFPTVVGREVGQHGRWHWFDVPATVVVFGYPEQWIRYLGASQSSAFTSRIFQTRPRGAASEPTDGLCRCFHGTVDWPAVMRQLVEDWLRGLSRHGGPVLRRPAAAGRAEGNYGQPLMY